MKPSLAAAAFALAALLVPGTARCKDTDYEESNYISESSEAGTSAYRFDSHGHPVSLGAKKDEEKPFAPKRLKKPKKDNARPGKRRPAGSSSALKLSGESAAGSAESSSEGSSSSSSSSSYSSSSSSSSSSSASGDAEAAKPAAAAPPAVGRGGPMGAVPSAGSGPPATPASGPAMPSGKPMGAAGDSGASLGDAQPAGGDVP